MSLFYDTELLEEMEWLVNCLIDDKVTYTASLNISSSDKKPSVKISNGRVSVTIYRLLKKLVYVARDEDMVSHARKEGFTEEQIYQMINCCHTVSKQTAEIMLVRPNYFAETKAELVKENIAKEDKENT